MRKKIRQYIPDHEAIRGNKWFAPFADTLLHPRLWHLNRHATAGGVAVGLFCGLIPGPLQMITAALLAVVFKVNLPLALFATLYTNPLTIVPLYFVAYQLGRLVFPAAGQFVAPPEWGEQALTAWIVELMDWGAGLGKPLALGVLMLALLLAAIGYGAVRAAYRIYLVRAWHRRRGRSAH